MHERHGAETKLTVCLAAVSSLLEATTMARRRALLDATATCFGLAGPLADLAALRLDGAEHDDHYSWFLVVLAHQSQQTPIWAAHPLLAVATSFTILFAPHRVACLCRRALSGLHHFTLASTCGSLTSSQPLLVRYRPPTPATFLRDAEIDAPAAISSSCSANADGLPPIR
jgi:hypothetical protein